NMPNTKPLIDNVAALRLGQDEVARPKAEWGIEVLFSGCVSIGQKGDQVAPLEELFKAGAVAFTDDGRGVGTEKVMGEAFAILEKLNAPLLQHAEMLGAEGPLAPGPVQEKLGLKPYDAKLETDMVERDLRLLKNYPRARYHLLHVSSRLSIPLMMKAKSEGLIVTSEVTPHHLYFSSSDIVETNRSFKMNPPIRGEEDRAALVDALAKGQIDWMATDHAPHESNTKEKSFSEATFGTVGLETSLQTLLALWKRGKLTAERLVDVFSTAPAKFLNIDKEYGTIKVGRPFRAVLVDVTATEKVEEQNLWGLSKNTCFAGATLQGKIIAHGTRKGWFQF
ncbi:MAG: amidohydrolase family protein, partial [Bdellovibrionota bacterium]